MPLKCVALALATAFASAPPADGETPPEHGETWSSFPSSVGHLFDYHEGFLPDHRPGCVGYAPGYELGYECWKEIEAPISKKILEREDCSKVGLYPIVTLHQVVSTTLYKVYYHIQSMFF
jgi:hypothetical protein